MRILVVDDIRSVAADPTQEVTYARTSEAAIRHLDGEPWDVLVLDHDLGQNDDVRSVVSLLEKRALTGDPALIGEVVIVTRNPAGAAWIEAGLRRHYRVRRIPLAGTVLTL
jgi:hypothetical protein